MSYDIINKLRKNIEFLIMLMFVFLMMYVVCNCAVHKKCHEKILGQCPGSAKDSRETKVRITPPLTKIP